MQAKDVVVRVQALDGAWETLGSDRARGVTPENVQLTSDQWGSKTASFDLRRDPKAVWPDIGAFAPVEVEVGGRLVWSGRVSETPVRDSTDSVIGVQCEGWQAHLDDDLYERVYAQTNLTEWKDARSIPNAPLSTWLASGTTEVGSGNIVFGYPNGAYVANGQAVGVVLDLGTTSAAKRIVVDWSNENVAGGYYAFRCRAFDSMTTFGAVGETLFNSDPTLMSSPVAATLTSARRYIALYLVRTGASGNENGDRKVRVSAVQIFADTAYESGNSSVLKADQVIKDALDRATLQLSSDRTGITAGTFSIPELAPSEPKTPREIWNAVNAFEDYQSKIDVSKRAIFKAKPSAPEIEVGAWSGMEFEDSSANSGDDIYSRVVVTGSKADGSSLRVTRGQGNLSGAVSTVVTSPAPDNPSFETNTTGWTASYSTITRDTGTKDSGTASGRWDNSGASDALSAGFPIPTLETTIKGKFQAGQQYTLQVRVKAVATTATTPLITMYFGAVSLATISSSGATDYAVTPGLGEAPSTTGFSTISLVWTPKQTVTDATLLCYDGGLFGTSSYFFIDTVTMFASRSTVVERRGFMRSKTLASSFTLTDSAAQQLGDKWLLGHKTSPFKGRAKLTGNQACREIKTGRNVAPEELLLRTGELIRFGDRIDPDTGAAGRDGRLVEAQYNADEDSVSLTIDSSRAGFEALLERLGVVLGQNRSAS